MGIYEDMLKNPYLQKNIEKDKKDIEEKGFVPPAVTPDGLTSEIAKKNLQQPNPQQAILLAVAEKLAGKVSEEYIAQLITSPKAQILTLEDVDAFVENTISEYQRANDSHEEAVVDSAEEYAPLTLENATVDEKGLNEKIEERRTKTNQDKSKAPTPNYQTQNPTTPRKNIDELNKDADGR